MNQITLRQNAFYIPDFQGEFSVPTGESLQFVKILAKYGFGVSEKLLHALNQTSPQQKQDFIALLNKVLGVKLNWTPLVKNWQTPTNETFEDHWTAFWFHQTAKNQPKKFLSSFLKSYNDDFDYQDFSGATQLQCGHYIPNGIFDLSRYNGCPLCGMPFEFEALKLENQGSKLKILDVWTKKDAQNYLENLLSSPVALDATQIDSVKILLKKLGLNQIPKITIKETAIVVVDFLIAENQGDRAYEIFATPTDILRYLWYKKTGFLQIIEPKILIKQAEKNNRHFWKILDKSEKAGQTKKNELKLKYSRKEAKMVAKWLNHLPLSAEKSAENMHPKRQMWVRFIRALRLAEYAKKEGFENLKTLLDVFYRSDYQVEAGLVEKYRLKSDSEKTFDLLKKRPGLFARSLFSNVLWFGIDETLAHFQEVSHAVPIRFLLTLNAYTDIYFSKTAKRSVKTILGTRISISVNPLVQIYSDEDLEAMKNKIKQFCLSELKRRFESQIVDFQRCYIDPKLFEIPLPIGDRSNNISDFEPTLMGEKFPLEGNKIRLSMQWGEGLPAQHLDMDLSCGIAYEGWVEYCSFASLSPNGCRHSGDIREIPNKIGTAEYIEIDVNELEILGAKFVSFVCNAYSNGEITPNLVVGWMDSKHPMKVSERKGVAYDPSCVIKQVRISQSLQKGLMFGILDIEKREIVWLEMAFDGQTVGSLDYADTLTLLHKLSAKISVGELLAIKAQAHGWKMENEPHLADVIYDVAWARQKMGEVFI